VCFGVLSRGSDLDPTVTSVQIVGYPEVGLERRAEKDKERVVAIASFRPEQPGVYSDGRTGCRNTVFNFSGATRVASVR
jgi:hypothetical protein